MILAGDIGGTNSRLALFEAAGDRLVMGSHQDFRNREFPTLDAVIESFLSRQKAQPVLGCFGIAGPIVNDAVQASNIPWRIEAKSLRERFRWERAILINDLVANAYGIGDLETKDMVVLNIGKAVAGGTRAVIAAGTGLGEAGMTWNGSRYAPFATEGGHADFAPTDELQTRLFLYLHERFGRVSYERLVSGMGLENIYNFLRDTRAAEEPRELADELAESLDRPPVISKHAMARRYPICEQALDIFISIYGAEAGNLALKMLSTGGMYVGGGIAPKILPRMQGPRFLRAFTDKGRMSPLLEAMPLCVVTNEHTGLIGAAACARDSLASTRAKQ